MIETALIDKQKQDAAEAKTYPALNMMGGRR